MSTTQAPSILVRVHEGEDADKQFVFHPTDDDKFVRTGRQVIDACRLGISIEVWRHEVQALVEHVRAWADSHADRVRACYICPRGSRLVLFVTPNGDQFDFDLADDLVDLNRSIFREFPAVGAVEVLQIPAWESDRFMAEGEAKPIYGVA